MFKGRDFPGLPSPIGSTRWWGWGFHRGMMLLWKAYSAEEANALDAPARRKDPVFCHNPDFYFRVDNLDTIAVNEILAMGIPAMSPSAGQTNVARFNPVGQPPRNINISTLKENGWPRDHETYHTRWLHSDCKNVGYLYTFKLFDELVTEGALK